MPPVPKPVRKEKIKNPLKRVAKESSPLECCEQETVAAWLDLHNVFYTATMAGSYLHPATFNRMKRMGLKKGVSDLILFDHPPAYHKTGYVGTCLEMKRSRGGKLSEDQVQWLAKMQKLNWLCFVAEGADKAIEFLELCGYGRRKP
jgi:hypothetical protein